MSQSTECINNLINSLEPLNVFYFNSNAHIVCGAAVLRTKSASLRSFRNKSLVYKSKSPLAVI